MADGHVEWEDACRRVGVGGGICGDLVGKWGDNAGLWFPSLAGGYSAAIKGWRRRGCLGVVMGRGMRIILIVYSCSLPCSASSWGLLSTRYTRTCAARGKLMTIRSTVPHSTSQNLT